MKIKIEQIMSESRKKEISPYLLIKRQLNYRKASPIEGKCKICKSYRKIKNKLGKTHQCLIIGAGCDIYSEVQPDHVCHAYTKK